MQPPILVASDEGLQDFLHQARQVSFFGVDTESNSLYAYYHRVCLIQISLPTADYVVDPLAIDVDPLGALFADGAYQKVFHAAENDILGLQRDFGFDVSNVFDTMISARILGWPQAGLAAILQDRFGVKLDKRMQRTDWGRRPLEPEQLAYAQLDTHYLLALRDQQEAALKAVGRWDEVNEAFERLETVAWVDKPFDPNGFWSLPGVRELSPQELAVLREVYLLREQLAQLEDRPPFRVFDQRTLLTLSRQQPTSVKALNAARGLSFGAVRSYGPRLVEAVQRGQAALPPIPPKRNHYGDRPDPHTNGLFAALRAWRTARARARGVEPDVVLTNDQLMAIARQTPQTIDALAAIQVMGPWKLREYGDEILRVLALA